MTLRGKKDTLCTQMLKNKSNFLPVNKSPKDEASITELIFHTMLNINTSFYFM